jgi:sugar phosphate isomerase/epimerase
VHSRIVVNEVCFPAMPLGEEIGWWHRAGVERVGLASFRRQDGDWLSAARQVHDAGIAIGYLLHAPMYRLDDPSSWPDSTDALIRTVDAAAALGVSTIYTTTGPKGHLTFEEAAQALAKAFAPVHDHAQAAGVTMLVETANPLFAHTHFLHTLADTIAVARQAQLGVCLDVHATWTESSLQARIREAGPLLGLVQVSDFVPGRLSVTRDVLGEGILPIESMVRTVLDTGYQGLFDLELFARPADTALEDTRRSVEWLSDLLERLGA